GEDTLTKDREPARVGTPPRRRGGRRHDRREQRAHRNTPVSAGRTRARGRSWRAGAEHPRVGGEDRVSSVAPVACGGTPPRRRGGLRPMSHHLLAHRNTPASAGRTCRAGTRWPRRSEHPRAGGRDDNWKAGSTEGFGTPPRRRGGRLEPCRLRVVQRNTPASAGRTRRPIRRAAEATEHPRVGGEDHGTPTAHISNGGTPPRRRGGLVEG